MLDPDASLNTVITVILDSLRRWGVVIVFGAMFLDCLPFAAFIAPGVIMLVLAGFVAASQSPAQGVFLIGAAAAGVISSDTLMYVVGRTCYSKSILVRRMVDKRAKLRNELSSQHHMLIFLYQFPPYSRMFAPIIMGTLKFSWRRWLIVSTFGTIIFVASFFMLGLIAGVSGDEAAGATKVASSVSTIFVFAFLVWLGRIIIRLFKSRREVAEEG